MIIKEIICGECIIGPRFLKWELLINQQIWSGVFFNGEKSETKLSITWKRISGMGERIEISLDL